MINDFKLGVKLMKHGLQFKSSMLCVLAFIVIGIVFEMSDSNMPFGGFYMMIGGVFIYQLVQSVTCAGLVQTSPQKKRLQTTASAMCAFVGTMIANTISIIVKLLVAHLNHTQSSSLAANIIFTSGYTVILMVYLGASMKAFLPSSGLFFVLLFGMGFFYGFLASRSSNLELNLSVGAAIAISYLAVIVGSALMYVVSLALYKKDFSKMTFESSLKRAK